VATLGGSTAVAIHLSSSPTSTTADLNYAFFPNTPYHVRWEIEPGVQDRIKIWTGGAEPASWDLVMPTPNALGAGSFSISVTNSSQSNTPPVSPTDGRPAGRLLLPRTVDLERHRQPLL
jgi:hypothetical protein